MNARRSSQILLKVPLEQPFGICQDEWVMEMDMVVQRKHVCGQERYEFGSFLFLVKVTIHSLSPILGQSCFRTCFVQNNLIQNVGPNLCFTQTPSCLYYSIVGQHNFDSQNLGCYCLLVDKLNMPSGGSDESKVYSLLLIKEMAGTIE